MFGHFKAGAKRFKNNNAGITSIEIVLILVVLVALVLIFKDQITAIIDKAFKAITTNTDKITG